MSYGPRSSLPAAVLAWLSDRLAHLLPSRPPGQGGTPPLSLEVRLDAVAAVILDGLSYRRARRWSPSPKPRSATHGPVLLPKLAALGFCQPDGSFITSLAERWTASRSPACGGAAVSSSPPVQTGQSVAIAPSSRSSRLAGKERRHVTASCLDELR